MKKFGILIIALAGFALSSNAQNSSADATATAALITPLSISKNVDMDFGTLAAGNTTGTAVLNVSNTITTTTGSVKAITGSPKSAKFTVTGEPNKVVAISYPSSSITLTKVSSTEQLTLGTFTNNIGAATQDLGAGGSFEIYLGATLTVPANSPAGTYDSDNNLTVTVNYN